MEAEDAILRQGVGGTNTVNFIFDKHSHMLTSYGEDENEKNTN